MPLTLPDPQLPPDPGDALQSIQRNFEALATRLDDAAVTAATLTASTTASATFSNGASSGSTLAARKYANGLVILSGGISNSNNNQSLSPNIVYATLPAGYRPTAEMGVAAPGASRVKIETDGDISFVGTTTGITVFLDGYAFHAA